jgi:hypothetical protein
VARLKRPFIVIVITISSLAAQTSAKKKAASPNADKSGQQRAVAPQSSDNGPRTPYGKELTARLARAADLVDVSSGTMLRAALWEVKTLATEPAMAPWLDGHEPAPIPNTLKAKENKLLELLDVPSYTPENEKKVFKKIDDLLVIVDEYKKACIEEPRRTGESPPDACIIKGNNPFAKLENLWPEGKTVLRASFGAHSSPRGN